MNDTKLISMCGNHKKNKNFFPFSHSNFCQNEADCTISMAFHLALQNSSQFVEGMLPVVIAHFGNSKPFIYITDVKTLASAGS